MERRGDTALLVGAVIAGGYLIYRLRKSKVLSRHPSGVWEEPADSSSVVIILGAGFGTRFQQEVLQEGSGKHAHLAGVPKPLLPIHQDKTLLDYWREAVDENRLNIHKMFVITNDVYYPMFVQWANNHDFAEENIISNGSSDRLTRLGACGDIQYALSRVAADIGNRSVIIIAGDSLIDFDFGKFLQSLDSSHDSVLFYSAKEEEVPYRGILEMDQATRQVYQILEKPRLEDTTSRLGCPAVYALRNSTLPLIDEFMHETAHFKHRRDSPGQLMSWLCHRTKVHAFPVRHHFKIDSLREYDEAIQHFSPRRQVQGISYARAGLLGNPSDGFFGKTIAVSIEDYAAVVTLEESEEIVLVPHRKFDRERFDSLAHLVDHTNVTGYYGGLRLMRATCKKFDEMCRKAGVTPDKNFTMTYDSTIPFACGMSGSSAIITASFKALFKFTGLTLKQLGVKRAELPSIILAVEKEELGINAGLQDRVIQVYEGAVYMDFAEHLFEKQGTGTYLPIPLDRLPPLYIAHLTGGGGDSGKIHSDVKRRWHEGDEEVRQAMQQFASFAEEGYQALLSKTSDSFLRVAELMDSNFRLRRKIYGDDALGTHTLRMIQIANQHNFSAKFTGSGGAIVCLFRGDGEKQKVGSKPDAATLQRVTSAFEKEKYRFLALQPHACARSEEDVFADE